LVPEALSLFCEPHFVRLVKLRKARFDRREGLGKVAALDLLAVCRSVACTVYMCVVLDRLADNAYIVFWKSFKEQPAGTDVRIMLQLL